jgi:integrase
LGKKTIDSTNYLDDPDPKQMVRKIKNGSYFKVFLAGLSFRDRAFARLLYYSKLNVMQALNLTIEDMLEMSLPVTLIRDLRALAFQRDKKDRVFISLKGKAVPNAHIYQSFRRVSERVGVKISPLDLKEDVEVD